ncbi:MAG: transporter [Chitinophagales bacterium]|jgi:hypothetical protein|nr:transporter [Chitinophagales bacterium]
MKIILFLLGFLIIGDVLACDACGSSLNMNMMTWNPAYKKTTLGVRYQHSSFDTYHPDDIAYSRESLNFMEFFGRVQILQKLSLSMAIPMVYHRQTKDFKEPISVLGVSDIRIQGLFQVLDLDKPEKNTAHMLQVGLGLKLPNADYQRIQNESFVSQALQPGTGAWDIQASAMYVWQIKSWRLVNQAMYQYSFENPDEFAFGSRISLQSVILREFRIKKNHNLLLGGGLNFDMAQPNKRYGNDMAYTGHQNLSAMLQTSYFFNKFALSGLFFRPIYQHTNQGVTENTWNANFTFQIFI